MNALSVPQTSRDPLRYRLNASTVTLHGQQAFVFRRTSSQQGMLMKAYRDSMLNVEKEKLNYARHGKAIRRLPLNVALADRQHRNIPRLRRQAREPFKTPRPQVKGKFVMPANAGI